MVYAPVRKDNPRALAMGIIDRTGAQTMLYLTCTIISSVDLAHYRVSRAKDWVSMDCGTNSLMNGILKINKWNFRYLGLATLREFVKRHQLICYLGWMNGLQFYVL